MPRKKSEASPSPRLRDACIVAAQEVIAERGIESLSLREVARKLGVSHQAPYKHYPSRDHLLAEVLRRCFRHFATHLDERPRCEDPERDLESLGLQYLAYARDHPMEYRLMFGTPWPESAVEPGLVREATHAFEVLRDVLRRMHGDSPPVREAIDLDALHVWATVHGLAGVMNGQCIDQLGLKDAVLKKALRHSMSRLGIGLAGRV